VTDYHAQIGGVYQNGRPWNFGVHLSSPNTIDNMLTAWWTPFVAAWTDGTHGLQDVYSNTITVNKARVAQLGPTWREQANRVHILDLKGNLATDQLPNQEAVVVRMTSDFSGPSRRGRFYLPALAEDQVNANVVIQLAGERIRDAISAWFGSVRADGTSFITTNRKTLKDGTLPFAQRTTLTDQQVSNKPARQARRNKKTVPTYY
jgi:hypothetical protein